MTSFRPPTDRHHRAYGASGACAASARRLAARSVLVIGAASIVLGSGAAIATAASPAGDAGADRASSRSWSGLLPDVRTGSATDARQVIVRFTDPSLAERVAGGSRKLTPAQRRAFLQQAARLQQHRLDALATAGVQFTVEHRYVRVLNGVSIVVHGDGAQLLREVRGVQSVQPVRTLWPLATGAGADGTPQASAAAAASPRSAARPGATTGATTGATIVAVLDTGIDFTHPVLAGSRGGVGFDTTTSRPGMQMQGAADAHGTQVAGAVLAGSRTAGGPSRVRLLPVRVLEQRPVAGGLEVVAGSTDDLLAGLEHVVDPDGDGTTVDHADVALVASGAPYAGFAGSAESEAVEGADALGTVVVAAAGNDGSSGDSRGTIGAPAAARAALTVGAADLREGASLVDLHVRGGVLDGIVADAPVLTSVTGAPAGRLPLVTIDAAGDRAVDFLDDALRSRVEGRVVLLARGDGVSLGDQVRAAGDAGAAAVLISGSDWKGAAGTIDSGAGQPLAVGVDAGQAARVREALDAGTELTVTITARAGERNPAYGTVAGFSSRGPAPDGSGRPDLVAPGVGVRVPTTGREDDAARLTVVSGTSVAAAWTAGAAAAVRSAHPDWDAGTVRSALVGGARRLGEQGESGADVFEQGAGQVDAQAAIDAEMIGGDAGRFDFGTLAPGARANRPLGLHAPGSAAGGAGARLLMDSTGDVPVTPMLSAGNLVVAVPDGTPDGTYGGWIVVAGVGGARMPWTVTVRAAADHTLPVELSVDATDVTLRRHLPGADLARMRISVGGRPQGGSLGVAGAQRLEVRLLDGRGRDHGTLATLEQLLPGVYDVGLSGLGPDGAPLREGRWTLQVRYVSASRPDGPWIDGPRRAIDITRARATTTAARTTTTAVETGTASCATSLPGSTSAGLTVPSPGMVGGAGRFVWPLGGTISSEFGPRGGRNHDGMDFAVDEGTPIEASRGGTVCYAGVMDGYGNIVIVGHPDGYSTRYAHLSRINVAVGQAVTQSQTIALSGNTGHSTGPHLHFEIRSAGVALDPRGLLPAP